MSFEFNHNLPPVSLDNYEEYFVLHIDGELNPTQTEALLAWLEQHPHLQEEFRLLQSTKLTPEVFSIDKESLLAHRMPAGSAQEDLLLLMDGELPAEKEKLVKFELAANAAYQQQYQELLAAKLDATEITAHPNRQELYRYERRVVFFRPWMRVAAAVLMLAGSGVWYFNNSSDVTPTTEIATGTKVQSPLNIEAKPSSPDKTKTADAPAPTTVAVAESDLQKATVDMKKVTESKSKKEAATTPDAQYVAMQSAKPAVQEDPIGTEPEVATQSLSVDRQSNISTPQRDAKALLTTASSLDEKNIVTIAALHPSQSSVTGDEPSANDDRKGSLKGFFKKAARTIGRKTGLSIEKEDGEVLVGAMALKLK